MGSQNAISEQPTGRNQVSGTVNGSGSTSASCSRNCFYPRAVSRPSAVAVNESGLGSSADGKGEDGIDRSFEGTGAPMHLGE